MTEQSEPAAQAPEAAGESHAEERIDEQVTDAAEVLDSLADRPLAEHAQVYEDLHARLQRTLAEIDGG